MESAINQAFSSKDFMVSNTRVDTLNMFSDLAKAEPARINKQFPSRLCCQLSLHQN